MINDIVIKNLNLQEYSPIYKMMQEFTINRNEDTLDELWILEHYPVFTQGQAGKPEHILNPGDIPIVQADRGGQVTYHGPGQLIIYFLLDLKRKNVGIRDLVTTIEESIMQVLSGYNIKANTLKNAPGVYINNKKICSLGLRIKKGCSYHGLSFNINMNLEPFKRINPCGMKGLEVTNLKDYIPNIQISTISSKLQDIILKNLKYSKRITL